VYLVSASPSPPLDPAMLSSIAVRRAWSALNPTNIVPWSVTVPYGVFRRKIFPKRSWSVLATCESEGLPSSSTLSSFRRPMTRSCSASEWLVGRRYLSVESLALVLVDEDERQAQREEVRALQPA
jgi:hypothetical protein